MRHLLRGVQSSNILDRTIILRRWKYTNTILFSFVDTRKVYFFTNPSVTQVCTHYALPSHAGGGRGGRGSCWKITGVEDTISTRLHSLSSRRLIQLCMLHIPRWMDNPWNSDSLQGYQSEKTSVTISSILKRRQNRDDLKNIMKYEAFSLCFGFMKSNIASTPQLI